MTTKTPKKPGKPSSAAAPTQAKKANKPTIRPLTKPAEAAKLAAKAPTGAGALNPRGRQNPLAWMRPPRQARTHATLGKFLDTAEELLATRSFHEISVSDLAQGADSSVGAFYRRFKDKDGLLHALHERYCEEAMVTADAALDPDRWESTGIAEIAEACLGFVIEVLRERSGLDRAVFERALTDPAFRERTSRLNHYVMNGMAELLLDRRHEIKHPDPEVAVDVALRQVFSFITDLCTVALGGFALQPLDDDVLSKEMTRSLLAYLGVRPVSRTNAKNKG